MLHSSNLDDSKSEWNGTHIIIPMIEGDVIGNKDSDKSLRNTITLNSVDGGDETVLTNGLEHSLVIGLDRNLFEANSNKSDLLVIQNTDLKLLSYSSESKNPVTYTLSYVDQDKSEIFRESSFLKDRIRSDWCSNNKSIFEVKDALNYDNAVLDSSKNWNNEKNEHFALDDDLTSNVSKIDGELLIPVEDTINADKKLEDVVENPHFIVNYFPAIQSSETVSLMSNHTIMNSSKPIENMVGGKSKVTNLNLVQNELLFSRIIEQLHLNELLSEGCSKNLKEIKGNTLAKQEEYYEATVYSDKSEENNHYETNMKADFSEESLLNVNKVNCKDEKVVLPERSLPPKKKAKMKSTIVPSWCKNFSFSINYEATAIKNENNCTKGGLIKYIFHFISKNDFYNYNLSINW